MATCEIHGTPLEEADVQVIYGIPYVGSPAYRAARKTEFPNACSKILVAAVLKPFSTCKCGAASVARKRNWSGMRSMQMANPLLQQAGRTWRWWPRYTTYCGRQLSSSLVRRTNT